MPTEKRSLKVFPSTSLTCACGTGAGRTCLCHAHIIPLWDSDAAAVRVLPNRLTTLALAGSAREGGVNVTWQNA